nr:YncE family protein [Sedimentibacter sp.]
MICDEKVAATGISNGRLMLFLMELCGDDYICKKALDLSRLEKAAIHSIITHGNSVYMADSFNNKIYKYDFSDGEFSETTVGRDPRHMFIYNGAMYVSNFDSDNISVIDLSTFTLTESIPAGIKPHDVIVAEKDKMLYTTCYEENIVIEYNLLNEKKRYFTTDGKPMHLVLSDDSLIVMTYFVNGNVHTKINFMDLHSADVRDVIEIEGLASDFLLNNNMIYIINIVDKSIYIVDALKRKIMKKIYLGGYPESISSGNKNIYVTNSKKNQIVSIDKESFTINGTIELNFVPDCIKSI